MRRSFILVCATVATFALSSLAVAQGNRTGHTSDTDTQTKDFQGRSGHEARDGHPSQGTSTETTTTTYSGPPGQISKENFDHQNVDVTDTSTSTSGPGRSGER